MQTFTTFLAALAAGTAFAAPTVYQNKRSNGVDHSVKVSLAHQLSLMETY
jgi:hypothetical protein